MQPRSRIGVVVLLSLAGCLGDVQIRPVKSFAAIDYGLAEKYVTLGGLRLCYVDEGKGDDVLVFLPPAMSSLKVWRESILAFRDRYRVVALDLPGHGKSDKPLRFRYNPETFAEVTARLLDHLGIRRATLVGNSNGGATALFFAIRYPDRARRLVLVSPAGSGPTPPWMQRLVRWAATPLHLGTANPYVTKLALQIAAFEKKTPHTDAYLSDFLAVRGAGNEYRRWIRAQVKVLRSALAYDASERAKELKLPTLILWGEKDSIIPVKLAKALQSKIPGAELTILPGIGHMPEIEVPDALHRVMEVFLKKSALATAEAVRPAPAPAPAPVPVKVEPPKPSASEEKDDDDDKDSGKP
jgi:pimeloyl-ACP methyl ester carboxylesterase